MSQPLPWVSIKKSILIAFVLIAISSLISCSKPVTAETIDLNSANADEIAQALGCDSIESKSSSGYATFLSQAECQFQGAEYFVSVYANSTLANESINNSDKLGGLDILGNGTSYKPYMTCNVGKWLLSGPAQPGVTNPVMPSSFAAAAKKLGCADHY